MEKNKDKIITSDFTVAKIFVFYYEIFSPENGQVLAVLRGKLRLSNNEERNPIAVGDIVSAYKPNDSSRDWLIQSKKERKNQLVRKSNKGDTHVLCANIDNVVIISSLKDPETKNGFLDRCIAATYTANINPILVFTKKDLASEEILNEKIQIYSSLGYDCISVSILDKESIADLKKKLSNSTSFLVGNSGTGKSSLINAIIEKELLAVNSVSETTKKGKHTTTNSNAIFLENNLTLIDSPGIKEWGLLHLEKSEILESFPELKKLKNECQVSQCCNLDSNCAMISGLENDTMEDERKMNLESILNSLDIPYRIRTGNYKSGKLKGKKSFSRLK